MIRDASRVCSTILALVLLAFPAGCDDGAVQEEVDQTIADMCAAADSKDGEAFAALLAPESFEYYKSVLAFALNGTFQQIDALSITEKVDILLIRNRCKRKEIESLDGRAWIVFAVNKGWYDGPRFDPETVYDRTIKGRGSTATMVVVYNVAQPLFTGEGSGKRLSDTFTFLKVEDRWLADWRRQSALLERLVELVRQETRKSVHQILEDFESKTSKKTVERDIWDKPMR